MAKPKDVQPPTSPLATAIAALEKKFGKESVVNLSAGYEAKHDTVSTGSVGLDACLGIGGLPRGRIVEIYGPAGAGKTTQTLHIIAEAQKQGHACAFIDAEHALSLEYAKALGVDIGNLVLSQPDYGEQALDIVDALVSTRSVAVIVVDSVASLTPKTELDGEMGDNHVGRQARMMGQAMRKLAGKVSKSNTMVVFINQLRQKIGVMFGSPDITPGGNALKFYTSVRLDIRRIGAIKQGDAVLGNRTRVKVVKNKLAPPFRQVEFDIIYGKGISLAGELIDIGTERGIVEKSGAWYSFNGDRIGHGKENAKDHLESNPEIMNEIRTKVLKAIS